MGTLSVIIKSTIINTSKRDKMQSINLQKNPPY